VLNGLGKTHVSKERNMKKVLSSFVVASTILLSVNANAGVGLSASAITALSKSSSNVLGAAILGGLGAGSIVHGVRLVNNGRIGWGVFFLILKENNLVTSQDAEVLNKLDVATQEAIVDISLSQDSEESKAEQLNALLN